MTALLVAAALLLGFNAGMIASHVITERAYRKSRRAMRPIGRGER